MKLTIEGTPDEIRALLGLWHDVRIWPSYVPNPFNPCLTGDAPPTPSETIISCETSGYAQTDFIGTDGKPLGWADR